MDIEYLFNFATELNRLLPSGVTHQQPNDALLDILISDTELRDAVASLFLHGHFAQAIEEALKFFDNLVSDTSNMKNESGAKLMNLVFSANKPILRFNTLSTQSEKDEQQGLMMIASGLMTGLRNPRAHDSGWQDNFEDAISILVFVNYLVLRVRRASA